MLQHCILKLLLNFCLFLMCQMAATTINAAPIATSKPIQIQSDSAEFNDKTGVAIYRGHVRVDQDDKHLTANMLTLYRNAQAQIEKMIATGSPAEFQGKETPLDPLLEGKANTIQYYPDKNKIILLEDAKLLQNGHTIHSDALTYDLQTRVLISNPVQGKRVTLTAPSEKAEAE